MLALVYQQNFLKFIDYRYRGEIDEIKGTGTTSAIRSYQKAKGLTADGIWGIDTETASINDVKELQRQLNAHGANLVVDGIVGPAFVAAVKLVQRKYGLVADGIIGPDTRKVLEKKTTSWDDIKYFKKSEFRCPCGHCSGFPVEMDLKVVQILDKIREHYGQPIIVTSGVRCDYENRQVGGVWNSTHKQGKAVDFYVRGQNDTAAGRNEVVKLAYKLGAAYAYCNTAQMGNAVHINV